MIQETYCFDQRVLTDFISPFMLNKVHGNVELHYAARGSNGYCIWRRLMLDSRVVIAQCDSNLGPSPPQKTSRTLPPIERFWRWLKAKVYGATAFDTIDDVISKVRQRIWHDHKGWLTSTIHFDFTDYQSILERFLTNYLFGLVFLLLSFRGLVTAFQEVCRLLKRGFEHAEQLLVSLHQPAVWIAALVMGEQPFMVANIRKE